MWKSSSKILRLLLLFPWQTWSGSLWLRGNQGHKFPACFSAGDESIPDAVGSRAQLGMVSPSRVTWTQLSASRLSWAEVARSTHPFQPHHRHGLSLPTVPSPRSCPQLWKHAAPDSKWCIKSKNMAQEASAGSFSQLLHQRLFQSIAFELDFKYCHHLAGKEETIPEQIAHTQDTQPSSAEL